MKKYSLIFLCFISLAAYAQQPDSTRTDSVKLAPPATTAPAATPAAATSASQPKTRRDTRPFIERLRLGGSTGFWIDPRKTYVELSGSLAYMFPKMLTTGVGFRYIYTHDRLYNKNLNTYGPNIFARLSLTRHLYIWAEQEILKSEYVENSGVEHRVEPVTITSTFLGLGWVKSFRKSGKGGLSIQVLYNFNYDRQDHSPYYAPVVYRVGYFF